MKFTLKSYNRNVPDEDLINDVIAVSKKTGRNTVTIAEYEQVKKPFSKYSAGTYDKRFGSWLKALGKFVVYISEKDDETDEDISENIQTENTEKEVTKRRTKRNISDRLRFKILMRDGFTCQSCGASPTKERGVELQVDHIVPWSKGGETEEDNLKTKCEKCNLG